MFELCVKNSNQEQIRIGFCMPDPIRRRPALRAAGIPWHGWYALRRGIGTQITANSKDPLAAKGMLRHENVATTQAHYIKDVPENTRVAMLNMEERVQVLLVKRRDREAGVQPTPPMQ